MKPRTRADLRADIEGLRGVAVAFVVLFHAKLLGLGGGFVGVDVFYVISGFLITGLLLNELATRERIDLAAFYARRAQRILPAATVAIVATLGAAAFVVAPLDLPIVAFDATASALFVSNVHFALGATDYFGHAAASPFLHFWSLAVEEQFYLAWPILLLVAARLGHLTAGIVVVFVSSLAFSLALTPTNGPWAFYLLPSRAWELALGGLLAVGRPRMDRWSGIVVVPAGWAGLLLLGVATIAIDASAEYPGTAAGLPTVGAALLIVAGERRFGPGRLLAFPPLRALGRVSYSVYLYHWPVLTLAAIVVGELSEAMRWSLVLVTLALGVASSRVIEEPFRRAGSRRGRTLPSLAFASAAVITVALLGQAVATSTQSALLGQSATIASASSAAAETDPGPPGTDLIAEPAPVEAAPTASVPEPSPAPPAAPRELRPRLADARRDIDGLRERGCGLSLAGTNPPLCELGDPQGKITIALVGDSHAAQWFPALDVIARDHGLRLIPLTKDSCIFLDMRIVSIHLEREYADCARWRKAVVTMLGQIRPDVVIVSSSRWVHPVSAVDADPRRQAEAMARLLKPVTGEVVILADTPLSAYDVPACLSRHTNTPDACATSRGYALTRHLARDGLAAELAGAGLIDPAPWLCGEETCPAVIDSMIVYHDDHHLTATFARSLAARLYASLAELVPLVRP